MDYEQKYNKALQKIRELIERGKEKRWTIISYEKDFEEIFPELKESEDEFEKNRLEHCDSITYKQLKLEQDFVFSHLEKYHRPPTFLDAIEYGMKSNNNKSAKTCKDEQVTFTCIGKQVTMSVQELINYYLDNECANTAEECNF